MLDYKLEFQKILECGPENSGDLFSPVFRAGIILYGAGSMGKMAQELLYKKGIFVKYFVDRSAEGKINGIKIIAPQFIPEPDKKDCTFIICISAMAYEPVKDFLSKAGCRHIVHFYDFYEMFFPGILPNGWYKPEVDKNEKDEIRKTCEALSHDGCSLSHYMQFLWWRLKRKEVIYQSCPVLTGRIFFKAPHFPVLGNKESFVDGGAHFGTTVNDFISMTGGSFEHIWAFEPDKENMKQFNNNLPAQFNGKITAYNKALFNKEGKTKFEAGLGFASKIYSKGKTAAECIRLDSIKEIEPSVIKLHLEGSELMALEGMRLKIKIHRPIIMVLADHSQDGLYKIAKFLYSLERYRLYFSLHDYCGNSAVFYAYPQERVK